MLFHCFRYFARTDRRRAQCCGLKEFNLYLQNDVRMADIIYEKSTVRLTSVGLAQARPNNNPRNLSCTADLSPISIPTGTLLYMRFLVELDNLCKCSYSHTHTICYKMAFDLHPILNLHLGCSYHLHSSNSFLST